MFRLSFAFRNILTCLFLFVLGPVLVLHYGRIGFLPSNQSIVFDGGWRIMTGQIPYRDFTLPSGLVPSAIQALFFQSLGVSWYAYVLHAAIFNGIFGIIFYFLLLAYNLSYRWSFFFASLSLFYFYVPQGVPYMEQHSFFFGFVALTLFLYADNSKSIKWSRLLLVLTPPILLLGYFSKQIPAIFFVLLIAFDIVYFKRYQQLRWLGISAAATLLVVVIVGVAVQVRWQLFSYYFFILPGNTGFDRLLHVFYHRQLINFEQKTAWVGILSIAIVVSILVRKIHQKGIQSGTRLLWVTVIPICTFVLLAIASIAIWHILTFAAIQAILLSLRKRRMTLPQELNSEYSRYFLHIQGLIVLGVLFVAFTNMLPENGIPFIMLCAGLSYHILSKSAPTSHIARWTSIAFITLVILDTAYFHVRINATRAALFLSKEELIGQATNIPEPNPLHFMQGPVYNGYHFTASELAQLADTLQEKVGAFWYFGDASVIYGISGKPSVDPVLWFHSGLTLPPTGTNEFVEYENRLIHNFHQYNVQYIVIEDSILKSNCRLQDFQLVNNYLSNHTSGIEKLGSFQIIKLSDTKK